MLVSIAILIHIAEIFLPIFLPIILPIIVIVIVLPTILIVIITGKNWEQRAVFG